MPNITIVTVNWFSYDFIDTLLANMIAKAGNPNRIKVLIIDNTNGKDKEICKLAEKDFECSIVSINSAGLKGSRSHAFALNHTMELIDTEFGLVVDPDIYIFKKNWDIFCIDQIQGNDNIAIGAEYPSWKVGKYHDFPSPPFCFFKTEILKNFKNDWTPYSKNKLNDARVFFLRQLGRLGGLLKRKHYEQYQLVRRYSSFMEKKLGVFSQDTGWRIAHEARGKKLKSILFNSVLPEQIKYLNEKAQKPSAVMASEYELFAFNNELMLTHKYGTIGAPWRTEHGHDEKLWRKLISELEGLV